MGSSFLVGGREEGQNRNTGPKRMQKEKDDVAEHLVSAVINRVEMAICMS